MDRTITRYKILSPDAYREKIIFAICLICVFLFSYTAYSKITEHQAFINGLSHVSVIGPYSNYISWGVPMLEILTAILLIIPKTCKIGLFAFLILMGIFTIYILSVL